MEKPTGRTEMNETEKELIRTLRNKSYSLKQIAEFVNRSVSSVKRVVYEW
jgi:IS30 family transposase